MKRTLALLSACSAALWAQNPDPAKEPAAQKSMIIQSAGPNQAFGPIGIQTAMAGPEPTVAGAPYSAEAVTERVQTLVDGNRIVQTTSSTVARDSKGRVRRDESLAMAMPGASKGSSPKLETINDPVAGLHWTLDPQSKTAIKMPFPKTASALFNTALPPPGPEQTFFFTSGAPGTQLSIRTLAKRQAEADTDVTHVDLGTQTVEGVAAQGTRITRTLSPGTVGNEQPLVITTETWYSPDLKVLVMSKADDPRMGVTTYRLTNLQRGEPSAALFEVPADYTVKDQPNLLLNLHKELPKPE